MVSRTSSHAVYPEEPLSEEAVREVTRVESSMQSESSGLHLYLDKAWSTEDFHSLRDPVGWRGKTPSNPEGGLFDFSSLEKSPRLLSRDEAEAHVLELLALDREKKRRRPNSEGSDIGDASPQGPGLQH